MELIAGVFIFCFVLFLYLHIQFHLKTSDNLEVYEIDQASKDKMEEICDLRQPVLFDLDDGENDKITKTSSKSYILENYPVFEVKMRNTNERKHDSELYMPLQMRLADKLCADDTSSSYFSENNSDFLNETGVIKNFQYNDEFLRPHLVSNCYYDIMFASQDTTTPLRYEINYRNYFMVTQGELRIKLTPPKSSKYLHEIKDHEILEYVSPINPWSPQPKYSADFDKIKCLEITLRPGKCLYIPAYWWYSFKFNKDTSISSCKYRTYMNNVAILPNTFMYFLQNQNVDRKIAKISSQPPQTNLNNPNNPNNLTTQSNVTETTESVSIMGDAITPDHAESQEISSTSIDMLPPVASSS
jgi:hypothetical protein